MLHWLDAPCQLVNGTSFRVQSNFHVLYVTIFVNTLRSNWFNPLRSYTQKCTLVYVFSSKNMFWLCSVFIMHESGHTYGNIDIHSRTSCTWQYLISSQILYGCALNTDFFFDNRYWHAVALRYNRNLLKCIWSVLDTLKVMLSCTWQMSHIWQKFCRPLWWQCTDY